MSVLPLTTRDKGNSRLRLTRSPLRLTCHFYLLESRRRRCLPPRVTSKTETTCVCRKVGVRRWRPRKTRRVGRSRSPERSPRSRRVPILRDLVPVPSLRTRSGAVSRGDVTRLSSRDNKGPGHLKQRGSVRGTSLVSETFETEEFFSKGKNCFQMVKLRIIFIHQIHRISTITNMFRDVRNCKCLDLCKVFFS